MEIKIHQLSLNETFQYDMGTSSLLTEHLCDHALIPPLKSLSRVFTLPARLDLAQRPWGHGSHGGSSLSPHFEVGWHSSVHLVCHLLP